MDFKTHDFDGSASAWGNRSFGFKVIKRRSPRRRCRGGKDLVVAVGGEEEVKATSEEIYKRSRARVM